MSERPTWRPFSAAELEGVRREASDEFVERHGPPDWDTATIRRLIATYDEAGAAAARHAVLLLRYDLMAGKMRALLDDISRSAPHPSGGAPSDE